MEVLRLYSVLLLVVENSIFSDGQSLLGAVENIFGIVEQPINENQNQRYTSLPNANPTHNNLQGSNLNFQNRNPNRNGLNTINNLANLNNNNKHTGLINPTTHLLNVGELKNIQSGVSQKVNQGDYEDADVKLAAQKFPDLKTLLDKLKEMNQQKESQKEQNGNNGQTTTTAPAVTTETNKDSSKEPIAKSKEKEVIKSMRKRKFYFQVQPVVPEDQKKEKVLETVYYED